jgi:hypothetical protein
MSKQRINRLSSAVLLILSLIALATVLSGFLQGAYRKPPEPDEGTAAHIFQLSVVSAVPAFLVFVFTADWQRPWRALRTLVVPIILLAVSFCALYYLEH